MGLLKTLAAAACAALGLLRSADAFATGHDLSSVGYMETEKGVTYYDTEGYAQPVESILGAGGMNSVRLRLWTGEEYGLNYTLALAKRFLNAGNSIYLDLHFSDTWADPGNQEVPAGWDASSTETLAAAAREYVATTLRAFTDAGVDLAIVSIGNEIIQGFLFPMGKVENSNFTNFAQIWAAARAGVDDAVMSGTLKPQVMIHVNNGWNSETMEWYFGGLFATGIVKVSDVDVIGVSIYPFYGEEATISALSASLTGLAETYGKPLYVAETDYPSVCTTVKLSENFPISPEGQVQWTHAIIKVLRGLPNDLGAGIFYWEPAFASTAGLGSACESALLFSIDWSNWPKTSATALSSVNMFSSSS